MSLSELLHELTAEGFSLTLAGGGCLDLHGPVARLTPELRQALVAHKPTLLQLLQPRQAGLLDGSSCESQVAFVMQGPAERKRDPSRIPGTPWRKPQHDDDMWVSFVSAPDSDQDQDYWDSLSEEDQKYIASSPPRVRCYFCGGISHHTPGCFGEPALSWGKYRGQRMATVPEQYLVWLLQQGYGRRETRQQMLNELQRRYAKYLAPEWHCILDKGVDW
jgi:hypothetical protein